jgi:hypothetical protein
MKDTRYVIGFVNPTPHRENQPNLTGPHMEAPADQHDHPESASTTLDLTISRSLAVKRFVGASPNASTSRLRPQKRPTASAP